MGGLPLTPPCYGENRFRRFQAGAESYEQRFWLEASTFSNRGEMRKHLPTGHDLDLTAGWKPAPHKQLVVSNDC